MHTRGRNIREEPAYGIPEAAHYLRIPCSTLRSWVLGQYYWYSDEQRRFRPLIKLADNRDRLLSFVNLVEAHVLDALRRHHRISLQKVRRSLSYLSKHFPSVHPLANHRFETDGLDLFVREYAHLINVTQEGQMEMRALISAHLKRVEWDTGGLPIRFFPFTRKRDLDEPKVVVIDPTLSFGRPVLVGTGIPTAVIAERFNAGDTMDELARDYDQNRLKIEEAVRCELDLRAA